jgi:carboxyl-terminal processing protease
MVREDDMETTRMRQVFRGTAPIAAAALVALLAAGCPTFLGKDPPATNRSIINTLWNDVNRRHALLDVKRIDWDAVYRINEPQVSDDLPEEAFFALMPRMLSVLDDKHMRIQSKTRSFNTGNWGSTGYVYLRSFPYGGTGVKAAQDWAREIDVVLDTIGSASAIVFDDRNNLGGLPGNVDTVASRFAEKRRVYALVRTKNGPGRIDLSAPVSYYLSPDGPRQYTRPVVLLTNNVTISGGEWFTLAMRSLPNVVHVGTPTAGAFSLSLERQLPNGWVPTMSVQKVTDTQEICYEGPGIGPSPDHVVRNSAEDLAAGRDTQLEAAAELARRLGAGS